jgi:hypothetical protein
MLDADPEMFFEWYRVLQEETIRGSPAIVVLGDLDGIPVQRPPCVLI